MPEERAKRRLAAILAADVVGYSRLMGRDEQGTVDRLKRHRRELVEPLLSEHYGRIVKLMGDGALCEFASVVDAVQCALAIQLGMERREADQPEAERIRFRMGINLGDVIVEEGGDLYGDGINVAARLQQFAKPGEIVISGPGYDQMRGRPGAIFQYLGEHRFKNIDRPVSVYKVVPGGSATVSKIGLTPILRRRMPALAFVPLFLAAVGIGGWFWWDQTHSSALTHVAALSDRPSIAVRPFQALEGDATTRRFAAGITEDIIADLGRHSSFYVIASTSSSAYDASVSARQVSEELGVRYVLEGSLQTDPKRVRITARLVDGTSGAQLWSERYDRPLDQLFDARDDVTAQIVATLIGVAGPLVTSSEEVARRKPPASLDAYDNYMLSLAAVRRHTAEGNAEARQFLERAIMIDPGFARAHATLAWVHWFEAFLGYSEDSDAAWRQFHEAARKAAEADPNDGEGQLVLGMSHFVQGNTSLGAAAWERALSLSPNNTAVIRPIGTQLPIALGVERAAEGVELVERALRLNPLHPPWHFESLGITMYFAGRYDEAVMAFEKVPDPNVEVHVMLALSYAMAGRTDEATEQVEKVLEVEPGVSAEAWVDKDFYQPGGTSAALFFEGARKAGMPLCAPAFVAAKIDPRNRLPECTGAASTK